MSGYWSGPRQTPETDKIRSEGNFGHLWCIQEFAFCVVFSYTPKVSRCGMFGVYSFSSGFLYTPKGFLTSSFSAGNQTPGPVGAIAGPTFLRHHSSGVEDLRRDRPRAIRPGPQDREGGVFGASQGVVEEERGGCGGRDPWRAIKRYRTSTVKWIAQNDNQLRVCTAMEGLQFLKPDWASPQWAEGQFESWPYASVALDQGGDGLSGYFACAYKPELRLNLLAWFD